MTPDAIAYPSPPLLFLAALLFEADSQKASPLQVYPGAKDVLPAFELDTAADMSKSKTVRAPADTRTSLGMPAAPQVQAPAQVEAERKPMQLGDLPDVARQGYVATASEILARAEFRGFARADKPADQEHTDWLAAAVHEAQRPTIERGWVVEPKDPPQKWNQWDKASEDDKRSARELAKFLLVRFDVQKAR